MAAHCSVHLRVISAHELPKTDLFNQIDPYVVVSMGGERLGRTLTKDNNPNPVWQEDFFFEAEETDEGLHGIVVLDLYDEEVTVDEYVASVHLDLQSLTSGQLLEPMELPLAFKSDKRGQKLARAAPRARLAVQIVTIGKGFSSYASELGEAEGVIVDMASRTLLVPVPDTEGGVWAGLRFGSRGLQLLLLSTVDPKAGLNPAVWYDLSYSGAASLRLERLQYRKPVKLLGLKLWVELRATNVPLDAKLSKVRILEREHRLVDTLDPAECLAGHNYMIGMPFLAAVKELSKRPTAHVDTAAQSIWIKMDANQPQPAQLLQLDYGDQPPRIPLGGSEAAAEGAPNPSPRSAGRKAGGGGRRGGGGEVGGTFPALRICSTSSELNRGYELAFFGGGGRGSAGPMVTVSESFRRPKPVLGGLYDIVHTVELQDAFVGDTLEEVGLGCYELMKPSRTWRLGKLIDAAARGKLWDIDEAGYGGGGGARGGAAGEGDGDDGGEGSGGGRGFKDVLRTMLWWVPCFGPWRANSYLEEGQEAAQAAGGKVKRRGSGGGSTAKGKEDWEGGRGVSRRRDGRSDGGDRGRSRSRARSGGGGDEGDGAGAGGGGNRLQRKNSGGGGGGGGARSGGGSGGGSRGYIAGSVGSSSGRSTNNLASYNSTKSKYGGRKGSVNSGGRRRAHSDEGDED